MPKIIENLRQQLLLEAKRQIREYGYAKTTVRSVAKACGVGVGTVYNYFESKDLLIANFMFEEWKEYLSEMAKLPTDKPEILMRGIYNALTDFARENEMLFSDSDVGKIIVSGADSRHKMLRAQISAFLLPMCREADVYSPDFSADFIAEALIKWSMEGVSFDALYPMLEKIIKK